MWLIIICVILFLVFLGLRISGKNRLYSKSVKIMKTGRKGTFVIKEFITDIMMKC